MKSKDVFVFVVLIFVLSSILTISSKEQSNNQKKFMIIERNQSSQEIRTFSNQRYNEKFNYGVINANEQEILELKKDKSIIVREPFKVKIFLDDAVLIQNVTNSWNLKSNQTNLTGQSQSVCVLDTGIDTEHSDLQDKIVAQHCFCASSDCCPNGLSEDTNATDDNGHGTHVAGIIAAQGNILGIAKQANLVVIKVMDYAGNGNEVDLLSAIEWCTENSEEYNISVISMSLGADCDLYPELCSENTCENLSSSLQGKINSAIAKNISMVIATGNQGSYSQISWPSCHINVTRVGSSNKGDSTISSFTNRNSLLNLLGVGESVNSTLPRYNVYLSSFYENDYDEMSGTSMATPMVSGAIAIINQYLKLSGQTKTPSQVETVLNSTGKKIYDPSSNRNYSRINVYSALLSLDKDNPNITINSPENNSNINVTYQNFSCNVSDWQLKNITLKVYNSTGLFNETSWNISGSSNFTNVNLTGLTLDETYLWNYLIYDANNNFLQTSNYTLNTTNEHIQQISPDDDFYTNQSEVEFICNTSAPQQTELSNLTFKIYNFTQLINETVQGVSGTINSTTLNYNFTEQGAYTWNCVMKNNLSESYASSNRSLVYDATYPDMLAVYFASTYNSISIDWNTSEITNASINLSDSLSNSIYNLSEFLDTQETTISGLTSSTHYNFTIFYCDKANNCRITETYNFTTSSTPSGGGGVGGASTPLVLDSSQLKSPQEISLAKGKSVKLTLSNKESHTLKVNSVKENQANITISSTPLNFVLNIGEQKKISVSNLEIYNLFILLSKISNSKAYLLIQEINESVNPVTQSEQQEEQENLNEQSSSEGNIGHPISIQQETPLKNTKLKVIWIFISLALFLIALKISVYFYNLFKRNQEKAKVKKRKHLLKALKSH